MAAVIDINPFNNLLGLGKLGNYLLRELILFHPKILKQEFPEAKWLILTIKQIEEVYGAPICAGSWAVAPCPLFRVIVYCKLMFVISQ